MKIIALDIGGTAVKSGLVDNGVLKEHRETPTPAAEGGQAVVALAKKLIAAYLPEGADGIGISTAGVVDSKSGSILFAEDCIRGYTGIQVKALLEDAFSLPTAVENDLNAAAVGEAAFGAGKGCKSLLCVGFGTSVGGAAVLDGRLYTGSHFGAGEFGHIPFFDNEIICSCGKKGCLETEVSGIAIEDKMCHLIQKGVNTILKEKYDQQKTIHIDDIITAAKNDDNLSIELIEEAGEKVGKAVAFLINTFNPETVIVGGNLAAAGDYIMLPLKSATNKYSLNLVYKDTKFRVSKMTENANAWGVAMLIRNKIIGL